MLSNGASAIKGEVNMKINLNPYESIYGVPTMQQKIGISLDRNLSKTAFRSKRYNHLGIDADIPSGRKINFGDSETNLSERLHQS